MSWCVSNELILIRHSQQLAPLKQAVFYFVVYLSSCGLFLSQFVEGTLLGGQGGWGSPTTINFLTPPTVPVVLLLVFFLVFVCGVCALALMRCSTFPLPANRPKLQECPLVAFVVLVCV